MKYRVRIVEEAEDDLAGIVRHIAAANGMARAERLLDRLLDVCGRLEEYPRRGHYPPEVLAVGVKRYRQLHLKPYRIIYEVDRRDVLVHVVADGRRSLTGLLEKRLLR